MKAVEKIKQKREFSELPISIIKRASEVSEGDVKKSRALLRKYFGVFLTNRILKSKCSAREILSVHISSRKRNYEEFYEKIFEGVGDVGSVIDLGCGVNGFSYEFLSEVVGDVDYIGVEAVGQLVEQMNNYFNSVGFPATAVSMDLFDIGGVLRILKKKKKKRVVFLFQVVDALENLERDFSKVFISEIFKECEMVVLSLPTVSLGGRKKFAVQRKWLMDFLREEFVVEKDFVMNGERVLVVAKRL